MPFPGSDNARPRTPSGKNRTLRYAVTWVHKEDGSFDYGNWLVSEVHSTSITRAITQVIKEQNEGETDEAKKLRKSDITVVECRILQRGESAFEEEEDEEEDDD